MPETLWPCRQTGTPAASAMAAALPKAQQAAGLVRREHDGVGGALAADLVDVGRA